MRTKLLTTTLLLLALSACKDKQEETSPPASAARPATPEPPKSTYVPPPGQREQATQTSDPTVHGASGAPRSRPPAEKPGPWQQKALAGQELFATLQTNQGDIVVKLYSKDAPLTVANFVGLATGEQTWQDPRTNQIKQNDPLYKNVIFHRVIPGFMIQGGDPLGIGSGSPGYTFEDETQNGRTFNKTGLLAMANRGPATNGSQFFITVSTPEYLNGRHTIFGEVVKGYDVVEKIAQTPRDARDRPQQDVVIKQVVINDKQPQ